MRLWFLVPGSILLICGILLMFAVGFNFVLGAFQGSLSVSIWHLIVPLTPTLIGLVLVWFAPHKTGSE